MEQCREKLVKCPNNCQKEYISRVELEEHLKDCDLLGNSREIKLNNELTMDHIEQLEIDMNLMRGMLNEELKQRFHLITEIGQLRRQQLLHNEWSANTDKTVALVQKRLDEEVGQRCYEVEQCQQDFRCIFDIIQVII